MRCYSLLFLFSLLGPAAATDPEVGSVIVPESTGRKGHRKRGLKSSKNAGPGDQCAVTVAERDEAMAELEAIMTMDSMMSEDDQVTVSNDWLIGIAVASVSCPLTAACIVSTCTCCFCLNLPLCWPSVQSHCYETMKQLIRDCGWG
ncbi:unnamed protein product [Pseudo-nitzschia multistriata]|uniref:Uncharacterized protein n=1 Tax=Pseudo-nitzschia multistriata TaxID=183589 RepID=A0A448YZ15_9STRA|nr:unnamed protein product [Pseudo-nitzschia multistriata]